MSSLHKPEKLLYDILTASRLIMEFTESIDKITFQSNDMILSACERKFEIIGEAFNRLKRRFPSVAVTFPELDRIIGFCNIIIHGYDVIDSEATVVLPFNPLFVVKLLEYAVKSI